MSDQPSAQEQVYQAVQDRGYTDGWTDAQFLARNMAKLTEELTEAAAHVDVDNHPASSIRGLWDVFRVRLVDAGREAAQAFDYRLAWGEAAIDDVPALRKELADCQVVLFCAAQALERLTGEPFDVVQAAVRKATADVSRGVRGG